MANDHDIEEAAPKGLLRRAWKYGSLLAVLAVGAWAGGMFPKTHRQRCHAFRPRKHVPKDGPNACSVCDAVGPAPALYQER